MRLLKLDSKVQQMVVDEMITAGHAEHFWRFRIKSQDNTAMKVFDEKLSVRETEKLVKQILDPPTKKEKQKTIQQKMPFMRAWKKK